MQPRVSAEEYRGKVIMSDGIPPCHQFIEQFPSPLVQGMKAVDFLPKRNSETPKIRTNATCLGIAAIQRPAPQKLGPDKPAHGRRRGRNYVVHAFGIKI